MATCIDSINAGGFPILEPSTATPIRFSRTRNQIVGINIDNPVTIRFNFNMIPDQPTTHFRGTATLFAKDKDGNLFVLGVSTLSDYNASFVKDFPPGKYWLCIRSNDSMHGTLIGTFQGFSTTARFIPESYHGETLSIELKTERPTHPCDEAMYYKIIEGELPPGINLTLLGRLNGILPVLDCLDDAQEYSPSFNWQYTDNCGLEHPWGRIWRFKVRVTLSGDSDGAGDEEWFCIRIHNQWDWDRDNFLKNAPFKKVGIVEVKTKPKELPKTMCIEPCPEEKEDKFAAPVPVVSDCPGCTDADVVTDIQLIPIPEQISDIQVTELPYWWLSHKEHSEENTPVGEFIKELKESKFFQALLAQLGLIEVEDDPTTGIDISSYRNFLQLTAMAFIDGRNPNDIDQMMLEYKHKVNQKLPIHLNGWMQWEMDCQLS